MQTTSEKIEKLCTGLLNSLEEFDRYVPPYGLYASDELAVPNSKWHYYQEWHLGIKPYLISQGAVVRDYGTGASADFKIPEFGLASMSISTVSKIKVRKYGSRYLADKYVFYDDRWLEQDMAKSIGALGKHRYGDYSKLYMLLFIGYDKAQPPFERELNQLRQSLNWDKYGVSYFTKMWQDVYGRCFGVRLSLWAKYFVKNSRIKA